MEPWPGPYESQRGPLGDYLAVSINWGPCLGGLCKKSPIRIIFMSSLGPLILETPIWPYWGLLKSAASPGVGSRGFLDASSS